MWLVCCCMHIEVYCTVAASESHLGKAPRGSPGRYPLVVEARLNVTIGIRIFTMWEVILYGIILVNVQLSTVAS